MTEAAEFQALQEQLQRAVSLTARLPDPLFHSRYRSFHCLEFVLFGASKFWGLVQQLLKASQDETVHLVVLEPDPDRYFYQEFGRFGALHLPLSASAGQYRDALVAGPGPPPDTFLDHADVMAWFPPSLQWIIWAERNREMMVLACEEGFEVLAPEDGCLFTAQDALDITSSAWCNRAARETFSRQLMNNFGGQPWTDTTTNRATTLAHQLIAGELGVIEASRALAVLRHGFDAPLANLFLPFVAIDSETDHLPVGSVRREWEQNALARKDVMIARYERLARDEALDAGRKLLHALQALAK